MSDKKRPPVRLGLQIIAKQEGDYFHVRAYPVTIGPTHWEMQCRDNGSYAYPDVTHATIRNAGDDPINGLRLDCLQADSQGNNDDRERKLYAWELRYRDVYAVDVYRAEMMYKTLKTIDSRMDKLTDKYGRPATFGQYIARVASAIGADELLTVDEPNTGWHSRDTYTHRSIKDGIWYIDHAIDTWAQANKPKPIDPDRAKDLDSERESA